MLQVVALILGVFSWALLVYRIVANKKLDRSKIFKVQSISWALCAVALYIPSLAQFLEFKENDISAMLDCVSAYHSASFVLLLVNFILSVISVLMIKKREIMFSN